MTDKVIISADEIRIPLKELEGRSDCKFCDGFGVMDLEIEPGRNVEAPCVLCSAEEPLKWLVERRNKAIVKYVRKLERSEIAEHNRRIRGTE